MLARLVVIVVLVLVPCLARAGGMVLETKMARTWYQDDLARHVEPADTPGDGGIISFGWMAATFPVSFVAVLMAHDVVTAHGGRDDNLVMLGVDMRRHFFVGPRVDLYLRTGVHHVGIYGAEETPLERYRGAAFRVGAGLRVHVATLDGVAMHLTADVVSNQIVMASDRAKDLDGGATHLLLGIEYTTLPR